jgi:hypothetical protein
MDLERLLMAFCVFHYEAIALLCGDHYVSALGSDGQMCD